MLKFQSCECRVNLHCVPILQLIPYINSQSGGDSPERDKYCLKQFFSKNFNSDVSNERITQVLGSNPKFVTYLSQDVAYSAPGNWNSPSTWIFFSSSEIFYKNTVLSTDIFNEDY